ncbi:acyl-CoA thioester hydrolase [Lipingzhangella halophila]|uniref:Acyl-CoA thioester hydrolase n=1 Tax=Lipingzhangella halophila TaxID=1783352 RepID=A0A7W7W6M3_9ACTN|nr:acyl-CoA thioesterase [Lipingzhangella halophila]MBB4935099.1 acyl-CoA thioester hydrolase [Lipingzhangella halophila]
MAEEFRTRVGVRGYELDTQGHLNGTVYHQYGEHARWECLRAAGISVDALLATGVGPVTLESTIRYHRELRGGDEVDVSCSFVWGSGKTFRVEQEFRRPDGELIAEISSTGGLMDLAERHLVADPAEHWRALATEPAVLNL